MGIFEELAEGESILSIMDTSGDIRIKWNRNNPDDVKQARKEFDKMISQGYAAYRTKKGGKVGDQIRKFDPDAERITMRPQMQGG